MLSHIFDPSKEEYNNASMPLKIAYDIITAEANKKFSSKVSHILTERNWKKGGEFDPNDVCHIKEMNADVAAAIYTSHVLRNLWESEYGKMSDEIKATIDSTASKYADIALRKFGWIKEENT